MDTRAPILDGNVKRVLARYHGVAGWPGQRAVSDALWSHAEHHTPRARVADYTQAMMDLGAMCCTRSRPACELCPLNSGCTARALGHQSDFPGRKPRKEIPLRKRWLAVATRAPGEVLLQKRPDSGIWGGLWAPPYFDEAEGATEWIADTLSLPPDVCQVEAAFHHTFTHFKLEAHSVRAHLGTNRAPGNRVECAAGSLKWFSLHPPPSVGLPAPIVRLLARLSAETALRSD